MIVATEEPVASYPLMSAIKVGTFWAALVPVYRWRRVHISSVLSAFMLLNVTISNSANSSIILLEAMLMYSMEVTKSEPLNTNLQAVKITSKGLVCLIN